MERRTRRRVDTAVRAAVTASAAAVLAGCLAPGDAGPRDPGPAAARVTVVRGDVVYPLTAEITEWEIRPHPQVPERGDAVHFGHRTTMTGTLPTSRVELAVCAVDSADIVLGCGTITVHDEPGAARVQDGDTWLGPGFGSDLSDTARVLLLPDQLVPDLHAGDPKDADGYVPPLLPIPGDRLRG